ncbi:hypothetical protein EDD16DRAFT_1592423 [Pisolithus croceorrhizus]|nr:hypothetical protein EDD16DRAFT_1592423 [Pisolithus croceorrhizus]
MHLLLLYYYWSADFHTSHCTIFTRAVCRSFKVQAVLEDDPTKRSHVWNRQWTHLILLQDIGWELTTSCSLAVIKNH